MERAKALAERHLATKTVCDRSLFSERYRSVTDAEFEFALARNRISPCIARKLLTILHTWDRWWDDIEAWEVELDHGPQPTGSREVDVAIIDLSDEDLAIYELECPLPTGFAQRKHLYRIWHHLVRVNLDQPAVRDLDSAIRLFMQGG